MWWQKLIRGPLFGDMGLIATMTWLVANADRDGLVERDDLVMGREAGLEESGEDAGLAAAQLDALHDAGLIDLTETVVVIHNFAELSEERRRVAAARNTRNHRARRAAAKGV